MRKRIFNYESDLFTIFLPQTSYHVKVMWEGLILTT